MCFSEKDLEKLREGYGTITDKKNRLFESYTRQCYNTERAREHAEHGFLRRVKTLVRCLENVFQILPPDREERPTNDELADVNINLQGFLFNAFGSTDNLAWIWVYEKQLTEQNGAVLKAPKVGLRPNNSQVLETFSRGFREYLKGLAPWFEHLESFRHALAHRIPLYVPPYAIAKEHEGAYRDLENRKMEAIKNGSYMEYDKLYAEQDALGVFRPEMIHSYFEQSRSIVFHPQLLTDFNTIDEISQKFLEELNR